MRIATLLATLALGCGARTPLGDCPDCVDGVPGVGLGDSSISRTDTSISGTDGAALDHGIDELDGGIVPSDGAFVDVTPAPATCPKALPKDNSPCSGSGSDLCVYVGCDPKVPNTATCIGGRWNVVARACTTAPDRCPATVPVDNSPCALPSGMFCVWDEKCIASSRGQCVGGKWQTKHGGCGGPDLCPSTIPEKGTTCPKTAPGTGFGCTYRNACGVPAFAFCSASTWGVEGYANPPCTTTPDCPSSLPTPGSGCSGSRVCVYPNGCGSVDYAQCYGGGTWFVSKLACPDTTCPPTPEEGAKCSLPGRTCTYPVGDGCSIACTCSSSWSCIQQPCGAGMGGGGGK